MLGQVHLGRLYAAGIGVGKDEVEAVRLFAAAAEAGDPKGQCDLATMYAEGRGITRDEAEAVRRFRLSADAGNADAQYALGMMYEAGRGVAMDPTSAALWYAKAVAQGQPSACRMASWVLSVNASPPKEKE